MSYHIYTTKGLVLAERPKREADRIYSLLTRDFGLVQAIALGVRKEESKLRGALEPYVFSMVSLVRGKEYWRITSAESIKNISPSQIVARPLALIEKFVQGEVAHPELFDAVWEAIFSPESDKEIFEIRIVSQILFHLGYLKETDLALDKRSLIKAINEGIQASHL